MIQGTLVSDPTQTLFAARTDQPDRDSFNLGAGLTATFRSGVSAFFYYETILGRTRLTNHLFTPGARLTFQVTTRRVEQDVGVEIEHPADPGDRMCPLIPGVPGDAR